MAGKTLFAILVIAAMAVSAGCAKKQTPVERFYGTSYELARQSQVHNPAAGIVAGPPLGLEGGIGTKVITRYEKGFERPAPRMSTYSVDSGGLKIQQQ